LQIIFDRAGKQHIRFDRTIPQEEKRVKNLITYPVILEMTTDYNTLGKFISSLEEIPHLVSIDRVGVAVKNNGDISARVLITCFLGILP
jgi:Tfp pilus assembly protein PilO